MNQNGGIHKGGFAVLCHRNGGSESPGILNGPAVSSLHRLDGFSVAPKIVLEEKLPVLFDKGFDTRQFIDFELLIFGRMGILIGPLLKRDISADKVYQPAVLLT